MDLDKIENGDATVARHRCTSITPETEGQIIKNNKRVSAIIITAAIFLLSGAVIGSLIDFSPNDDISPPEKAPSLTSYGEGDKEAERDSTSHEETREPTLSPVTVTTYEPPKDEEATAPEEESENDDEDEGNAQPIKEQTVKEAMPPSPDNNITETRLSSIATFLIKRNVTVREELETDGSYANQALKWLAHEDPLMLPIPDFSTNSSLSEGETLKARYVLALIYFATGGTKWSDQLNFLSEKHTCEWMKVIDSLPVGVGCSNDGEIVALSLNNNRLQNSIPAEIGLLTNLKILELGVNFIAGSIPDSFQDLTGLEKLHIDANGLIGTLPKWIGRFDRLLTLQLGYNSLRGELPSEVSQLPALRTLALDHNNFEGDINNIFSAPSMSGLQFLEGLFLEDNNFHGSLSPEFLASTSTLRQLDISDNSLTGGVPDHFFQYTNLEVLDIHDNEFSSLPKNYIEDSALTFFAAQKNYLRGPIPEQIVNLSRLSHLDLSQNHLTGSIPESLGENLVNLKYLFLAENDFDAGPIPFTIPNMAALKELSLKGSNRTGVIPDTLGLLTELVLLDLDNNSLNGEIPSFIGSSLTNLRLLLLNRNNLSGEIPATFGQLTSLELLFLEGNGLTGGLEHFCSNLEELSALVGQCSLCDDAPECCNKCCEEGVDCNSEFSHVADLDPLHQMDYERIEYTLDTEDWFD